MALGRMRLWVRKGRCFELPRDGGICARKFLFRCEFTHLKFGVNGAREASTYYRSTKPVTWLTKLKIFSDCFVMGLEAFVVPAFLRL